MESLRDYKQNVGLRKLVRFHVEDYTRDNFRDLIRMNLFKLNKILRGRFETCTYDGFLSMNDQAAIAGEESDLVGRASMVSVLNTLLFFPLEYFGNAKGFFDEVAGRMPGDGR